MLVRESSNDDDDASSKEEKCDENDGKPKRFGELDTCHQNQDMRPEFREVVSFSKNLTPPLKLNLGGVIRTDLTP